MTTSILSSTNPLPSTATPVRKWLHHRPYLQKTAAIALATLGFYNIFQGFRELSASRVTVGALMVGSGSILLTNVLPLFIPPAHPPKEHVFASSSCKGVSLYHYGDLPILKIPKEVSPFDAGYAKGFLMAPMILKLFESNYVTFCLLNGLPSKIPHLAKKMEAAIPEEYLKELNGIVAGYSAAREKWLFYKGAPITLDDLIYSHLLPDLGHLDLKQQDSYWRRQEPVMGCTSVIDGNEEEGPKAIRTVDWVPGEVYGKYAYLELRETQEGVRSVNQSFPGFIGYLTAMNESGLTVAVNVARGLTDYASRIPTVFFLRKMAESCSSVTEAEAFLKKNPPIGPFNLTLLDEKEGCSVHFFQGKNGEHTIRRWSPGKELITLNFRYGEKGETNATTTNSEERKEEIEGYYNDLRVQELYEKLHPESRLKPLLKGDEVNNIRTTTASYLDPQNRYILTAFDNGYAGDRPLMETPSTAWLKRKDQQ